MSMYAGGDPPEPGTGGRLPSNVEDFGAAPGGPPPAASAPAASAPQWASAPAAVTIEPTVGGAYSHAWAVLKTDFWRLLLIGFVAWLLGYVVLAALSRGEANILSVLYQFLVAPPIFYGAAYAFLRAARGERPEVGDIFVPFQRNWLSCVLANLLLTVILVIGFVLLILPGIYLAIRLSFVPYLVVDERRGPVEALFESWKRTDGYFWTIFGAGLLAIVVVLVGLVLLVIGTIPATMLVYLAFASLYAAITERKRSGGQVLVR